MSADYQSSNNPFRRKAAASSGSANPNPTTPSSSTIHDEESLPYHPPSQPTAAHSTDPKPATRTKPVKRVRVQTPPPLSSDSDSDTSEAPSPPWGHREARDPSGGAPQEGHDDTPAESGPPRRNPFSKTLHDIDPGQDNDGAKASGRAAGKPSLDVAAFQRLLLTGQSGADNPAPGSSEAPSTYPPSPNRALESSSSSPSSRSSAFDTPQTQSHTPASSELPRTTHHSPPHDDPLPAPQKRRPPPPSSRHGKALGLRIGVDTPRQPAPPTPPLARTPSGFNKPLPAAPVRTPSEEDAESIFDREAAGRAPESSGPPSPAVSTHENNGGGARRLTPAPPPRRRQDGGQDRSPPMHTSDPQRRTSVDSTHSRTDSLRGHAPAPPPPRRPNHRSTPSHTSLTSPSTQSFSIPAAPDTSNPSSPRGFQAPDAPARHVPRPPPARNPSTRRKTSGGGAEGQHKRVVSRDGVSAPPPPPSRQRGGSGSRESLDPSEGSRRGDPATVGTQREGDDRRSDAGSAAVGADDGQVGTILADLGALQREVEALQKQYQGSRG